MTASRIDDRLKCDDRNRPIHVAGELVECPTCQATRDAVKASWRPPLWQLVTPFGTYDYDRKPRNPITRLAMYFRGYRWRKNPFLVGRS